MRTAVLREQFDYSSVTPARRKALYQGLSRPMRRRRCPNPDRRHCIKDGVFIDPCMGSGHILVYAFEVLHQIYLSQGYAEREIPNLILQNNIYGLDVDDRAGQLAYFALMIKARSYNRRFFRQENIPQPMVYSFPERKWFIVGVEKWLGVSMAESDRKVAYQDLLYLAATLGDDKGKTYGSAIKIEREIDFARLRSYIHDFATGQITMNDTDFMSQATYFDQLIDIAEVLAQKYDVAVTNPPYMAPAPAQADWVKKNYPDTKSDLCVVFIERNFELLKPNGYLSMITMHSWMFLSSYEKFREKLIASKDIVNMAHLGARAFEEIGGEVVQTTAFVMRSSHVPGYLGTYARLVDYAGQQVKEEAFWGRDDRHIANEENFEAIPGMPIAYWANENIVDVFRKNKSLFDVADVKQGLSTADNDRFLKLWFEVSFNIVGIRCKDKNDALEKRVKWVPLNKGGEFRRWYGNNDYLVNWENDGAELKTFKNAAIRNESFYFQDSITWTLISSSKSFGVRFSDNGSLFEAAGSSLFCNNELLYLLGLLSSKVATLFLEILNPTLNFSNGIISKVPYVAPNSRKTLIDKLVQENVIISRTDWDCFETSWDFKLHPLIQFRQSNALWGDPTAEDFRNNGSIQLSYKAWATFTETQFSQLKYNEEELNRIFIDIYGLQDELTPEVENKDVTIRKADLGRDIRSFISYAVGCMFGRYSLDEQGLVFAGGTFDKQRYKTFLPEEDNILPIGSADYFEDDIVVRFVEFVRTVYGNDTLSENLNFIADALYPTGNGSAQEKIRRYFLNDFYKDHLKIYQKRPIYWLLDSGKKDGFKALFYLHSYDKYTIARVRTDYLHPLQRKYEAEIKRYEVLANTTDNARDKAAYRKEMDALQAKIDECRTYDQVVSHIAHQQIELDLDDGVKVNYARFQGVEVPKDNGKTEKMDLLAKI